MITAEIAKRISQRSINEQNATLITQAEKDAEKNANAIIPLYENRIKQQAERGYDFLWCRIYKTDYNTTKELEITVALIIQRLKGMGFDVHIDKIQGLYITWENA